MSNLPTTAAERKAMPIARGVLDYFPDALAAVAEVSRVGNEQHNPGQPLHWAKEKSTDEADCLMRHLIDRGKFDTDGLRHSAKVAWRALALLQRELEEPTPLPESFKERQEQVENVVAHACPDLDQEYYLCPCTGPCARKSHPAAYPYHRCIAALPAETFTETGDR